ncbi:hypothetical protein E4U59_004408 [Claviceps monticola]|nr:hypothetical protein E4U59_004408 [Claviceps monticola]
MASDPLIHPDNRNPMPTSIVLGMNYGFESLEKGASTEISPPTAVHAIEAPSIEVGRHTNDDFNLSSVDDDDASTTSLASSVMSTNTYERGRRYVVFGDVRRLSDTIELSRNLGNLWSLRPGGWIELQELLVKPLCDDGTMPDDDPVKCFLVCIRAKLATELGPYLQEAGFGNIHCQIFKVPIGPWAKDNNMRVVGLYQSMAVKELLPTLAGRPFQALKMSEAEIEVTIALARKGLDDPNVHRYFDYYFWYAQRPGSSRADEDAKA